jgi:hypothetical protein
MKLRGQKHVSLVCLGDELEVGYLFSITFTDYEAYTYWKGVEEEGPDYWERYGGGIMMELNQILWSSREGR